MPGLSAVDRKRHAEHEAGARAAQPQYRCRGRIKRRRPPPRKPYSPTVSVREGHSRLKRVIAGAFVKSVTLLDITEGVASRRPGRRLAETFLELHDVTSHRLMKPNRFPSLVLADLVTQESA